jgi:head-tail adaptor
MNSETNADAENLPVGLGQALLRLGTRVRRIRAIWTMSETLPLLRESVRDEDSEFASTWWEMYCQADDAANLRPARTRDMHSVSLRRTGMADRAIPVRTRYQGEVLAALRLHVLSRTGTRDASLHAVDLLDSGGPLDLDEDADSEIPFLRGTSA